MPKALFDKSNLPIVEKKNDPIPSRNVGSFVPPAQTIATPIVKKKSEPGALFCSAKTSEVDVTMQDKAKFKNFTPMDIAKIKDVVAGISLSDRVLAIQFGQDVSKKLSAAVDDILEFVKNNSFSNQVAVDAKRLHELLQQDFTSEEPSSFFSVFVKKKTIDERISELIDNVEAVTNSVEKNVQFFLNLVPRLDELLDKSKKYHREILILVAAGKEKISDFKRRKMDKLNEQLASSNVMIVQNARDELDIFNSFVKRVETLEIMSGQNELTLAQIRMTQSTNVKTVESLNNIVSNLIPLWKQSLISAISSKNFDAANENKVVLSQSLNDIIASKSLPDSVV